MCIGSEVEINMRCFQEVGRSPHVSGVQGSRRAGSAEAEEAGGSQASAGIRKPGMQTLSHEQWEATAGF